MPSKSRVKKHALRVLARESSRDAELIQAHLYRLSQAEKILRDCGYRPGPFGNWSKPSSE